MKKGKFRILEDGLMIFYCEGCKRHHYILTDTSKTPNWSFNGDYNKPTIRPSILVTVGHYPNPNDICHSFITDGKIQYLSDCYHELAGKTIDLLDMEDVD